MRIRIERPLPGIDPVKALNWWWDFRPGGHDHAFLTLSPERSVRPVDEGEVFIHDRFERFGMALFEERLVARVDGHCVRFEGQNTFATFSGAYVFRNHDGPTRVELDAQVSLRPGLGWTEPVARRVVQRLLERDLEGHVEAMQEDLARARSAPHVSAEL